MSLPIQGLSSLVPQVKDLQSLIPSKDLQSLIPQARKLGLDIAGENSAPAPLQAPILNGGPSFGDTLKRALGEVSAAQDNAQDQMQKFLNGEPVELHQVMAASEEAGLATQMLVEIRNKVLDAYHTIVNMQS